MTNQLTFLESPPPYQHHSDTSRDAAQAIKLHIREQHQRILSALRALGPLTDEQLADATQMPGNTVRPRRIELWRRGHLSAVGKAKTRSGRAAVTWDVVL